MIQVGNKGNILIDTGGTIGSFTHSTPIAKSVVLPYLQHLGIHKIDLLVLTHGDNDHIGGEQYLTKNIKVGQIWAPLERNPKPLLVEDLMMAQNSHIPIHYIIGDETLHIYPNLTIEALSTGEDALKTEDENANSLILNITYGKFNFLFTGDLPSEEESKLIEKYPNLRTTVLKVGHHGSKTSSSNEFLDSIQPSFAVISVGRNNRYHHPNLETLEKLKQRNISVYRTDTMGEIIFETDGFSLNEKTLLKP